MELSKLKKCYLYSKLKQKNMKKRFVYLFLIVASTFLLPSCSYNSIISNDEAVKKAWADVEHLTSAEVT